MLNLKRVGRWMRGVCCITSKTLKAEENLFFFLPYSSPWLLNSTRPFSQPGHFHIVGWMRRRKGVTMWGGDPSFFIWIYPSFFHRSQDNWKNPLTRITQEPSRRYWPPGVDSYIESTSTYEVVAGPAQPPLIVYGMLLGIFTSSSHC